VNVRYITTPKGEELAILPRAELEALRQAAEHARAVADYRSGRLPGLSPDETRALIAAASPLVFWRKYRGMTQAALAETVGVTQGYLSDVEKGRRDGPAELWLKLSRALNLPIEALIGDD
jgi:DNA-binding XRE family transcriptional regulator